MDSTADIHHAIWLDGALRLTGPAPQRAVDHPTSPHFAPDSSTRDWAGDIAAARFLGDDPTGRRWFTAPNNAVYVTRAHRGDPAPAVQVLPESPGASPTRLLFDANGTGWLASETGVVRLAADLQPRGRPKALLRRVSTIEGDSMLVGTSAPATPLVVPYKHGGVRFSFASPVFEYADLVTYRVRLDGLSERWSDWEAETYRDFVNLSEGTYTFRVQARDALGRTSDETLLTFSVLPPWYRTWWAFVLWMSVGIAVVIGIAWGYGRYRGQQLALRNASLERAVAQRTSEIVRQKQEVEHQRAETERQRAALQQANGELHRLNHRLEGRTVELREALEQNKEFLGVAAHDLKNPLGGIAGIAEVLLDGEADLSPNEQRESLSMIHASALRGVELITNLLDDGHALSAGPVLHKRLEDVVKLTHAVVRWNVPQAEAKRIAIRVETPTHLWADLDASAIQRAFDNYLSNAVKYSPPGSSIEVRLRPTDDAWAHFEVRDDGPGLTSDDQAVAFGKLQRLSARPTGGEHSTGLGLYIVKQLVEAHGGEVGVDSVPGDGATFWLRVPLTPQETGVTAAASEGEVPA
ncbi:MAG: ATP-binding protein [Bacteroidota bacterium]